MKTYQIILFLFLFYSCNNKKNAIIAPQFDEANWSRIVFKGEEEATAIFGNIKTKLFVSTANKVYSTIDQGKTWEVSLNRFGPIYDFLAKSDTIYAFSGRSWNTDGLSSAEICQFFTIDNGKNWKTIQNSYQAQLTKNIGIIENGNFGYQLKDNYIPKENNVNSWLRGYSEIQIDESNIKRNISLPLNNFYLNIHLDERGYLYLATSTCDLVNWNCKEKPDAVVYVSKKPFPR